MARTRIRSLLVLHPLTILTTLLLLRLTTALEVAPSSLCAPKCLDNPRTGKPSNRTASSTHAKDLACFDWEYSGRNSTATGRKFGECNGCLRGTGYADQKTDERDSVWFLFNNRATIDWCLFGRFDDEKNAKITQSSIYKSCNTRCTTLYAASDFNIRKEPGGYGFCDYQGNYTAEAEGCMSCLYEQEGLTILGNVLATVVDMCKQKPGKVYSVPQDQTVYTATRINLTGARTNSTSSPTPTPTPDSRGSELSAGAIAGIVLGGLVGIALILCCILLLLRRLRTKNKEKIIPMPHADAENGNANAANGGMASYAYDAMGTPGKDQYSYAPPMEPPPQQEVLAELPEQVAPSELPATPPVRS